MNYYEILRVSQNANLIEIKRAYKTLVKRYHPDLYEGNKLFAETKIKEINQAYEVLKEKSLKQEYDAKLHNKRYEPEKSAFIKTIQKEDFVNYQKIYNENFYKENNIRKKSFIKNINLYEKAKKIFFKIDSDFERDDKEDLIIMLLVGVIIVLSAAILLI